MQALYKFFTVPSLALFAVSVAYATQPPDVVNSDGNYNTAMGTDALQDLTSGVNNTAAGNFRVIQSLGLASGAA
jgi:hypothetical protein